jgi:hypothetical protein
MTNHEVKQIAQVLAEFAETVAARLNDIEERLQKLEAAPRESFAAKLRARK